MPTDHPTDDDETLGLVRKPDHDTSEEAAESILPSREQMKRVVWRLLDERPRTDEELTLALHALGIHSAHSSAGKRRGDLVAEGLVIDSGERRPNSNGRKMIVWRLTDLLDLASATSEAGGIVPEYITDRIAGHEGDQP